MKTAVNESAGRFGLNWLYIRYAGHADQQHHGTAGAVGQLAAQGALTLSVDRRTYSGARG